MGLRGIGAKPIAIKPTAEVLAHRDKQPWERYGLSRAERVATFLETLPVSSGALRGTKFKVRDWQWKEIIEPIYRTDAEGHRYVREAVISIPRKNGKTGLVAGLALCHLVGPESVERGQVVSAANAKKQSKLIFAEMSAIVRRVKWMDQRINIQNFVKRMEDLGGTESTYEALAAEVHTEYGQSLSFWIYDELGQSKNRELYDVLSTSGGAWEEPLGIVISTQAPTSMHIMSELVDDVLQVKAGVIEDKSRWGCIYTAPLDADPWSEETWKACNPALGDFRSLEDMRDLAKKAKRIPAVEQTFRNLYLNQRINRDVMWIPSATWDLCGESAIDFDESALLGRECYGALDLSGSGRNDLTSLVLMFEVDSGHVKTLPLFWAAEDSLYASEHRDRVPYREWANAGHLQTNPGALLDYAFIAQCIAELSTKYVIKEIAVDPWNHVRIVEALEAIGANVTITLHGQGVKDMDPSVKACENMLLAGKLRHNRNPILAWCINNVKVLMDSSGNRKFDKRKATGRIDGAVALVMAAGLVASQPQAPEYRLLFVG